ncbi:MAG: hypothetical protein CMH31_00155 [Micavibrio sp.]|nr:hypothetical protein [Micavibrio sp.]
MSEDFNACAKAQLVRYLPKAIRSVLHKHTKITTIDTHVFREKEKNLDKTATMKLTIEQQKAGKSVISHLEALIKLARIVIDDAAINETPEESKKELLDMIKEAQERVSINRQGGQSDA